MIRRLNRIFLLFILFSILAITNVLAYEDDLFKFDLPDNYKNMSYNNELVAFVNENNEDLGIIIAIHEDKGLKKSVWDIEESDLNTFTNLLFTKDQIIEIEKRSKLGNEKAIKYIVGDEELYMELYVLASNKYVYIVTFTGKTISDLSNPDYRQMQKSFKLKDSTTDANVVYMLVFIAITVISIIIKSKKASKQYNAPTYGGDIDYKNMTEEDFNNL